MSTLDANVAQAAPTMPNSGNPQFPKINNQFNTMLQTLPTSIIIMPTTVSFMLSVSCLKALITAIIGSDTN